MNSDRIEKKILLKAPIARVWRALANSQEFGYWFGMRFDGPFTPGAAVRGAIAPTGVNKDVAEAQKEHEGLAFEIWIEQMLPEKLFSYRWHPYAVDRTADYSQEPTTLVEFRLEPVEGGVMLTVTESGFDRIPAHRRNSAYRANDEGWGMVVNMFEEYLAGAK